MTHCLLITLINMGECLVVSDIIRIFVMVPQTLVGDKLSGDIFVYVKNYLYLCVDALKYGGRKGRHIVTSFIW